MAEKQMRKRVLIFVLVAVLLVGGGLSIWHFTREKKAPDILARVGPHDITVERFTREMIRRGGSTPERLDKKALLDEMIDYETLLVKALEAGLDKDPVVVRSYRNTLVGKLRQQTLLPRIDSTTVSDEEVQAHYEKKLDRYTRPGGIRLALLYLKTHLTMSEEKFTRLKNRMAEAREKALQSSNGRGFGSLAVSYSEDQATRYKGGDLGWMDESRSRYRWDTRIVTAGFSLEKPGDISEIITTEKGLYLVKLIDRREPVVKPLERVKARIRHTLLLAKKKQTEKRFLQEMRAATRIEVYPDILDGVALPNPKGPKPMDKKPPEIN